MNVSRIATVAVLAPFFILVTLYGPFLLFAAFMEALVAVCFIEYANMARAKGIELLRPQGLCAALILPLAFIHTSPSVVYIVLMLAIVALLLKGFTDPERGMERVIFTLFGVIYTGLPYASALLVREQPEGEKLFLLVCFATWGADIGAYYAGRAFGKTKLAPGISPNKTVEGFVGGAVASVVFASLAHLALFGSVGAGTMLTAGLIGGFVGPVGDLSESMMKRYFGVKDSGAILPGHGGLLDRADALMFTTPLFYTFIAFKDGLF